MDVVLDAVGENCLFSVLGNLYLQMSRFFRLASISNHKAVRWVAKIDNVDIGYPTDLARHRESVARL